MTARSISAEELDRLFDEGSDEIDRYIDWSKARRLDETDGVEPVALPAELLARVDAAAVAAGVSRQALVARWIAERLDAAA